jgi:hypothetical protein
MTDGLLGVFFEEWAGCVKRLGCLTAAAAAGQSQAKAIFFSLARPKRSKPMPTGRPPRRQ